MVASSEISKIFGFKYREFQKYSDSNMVASNTEISEIFGFKYGRMRSGISKIFGSKYGRIKYGDF